MCDFHECLVGPHIPGDTETSGSTLPMVRQLLMVEPRTELRICCGIDFLPLPS